jgi:Auxiliary Activity family 9 (formerly GH61)
LRIPQSFLFVVHIAGDIFFTCSIMKTASLFIPLLSAAFVSAHGYISRILINGKPYIGNAPGANPVPSIIRQVGSTNPIKGAQNIDLTCGNNSPPPAALVADANPGDLLTITWEGQDGSVRFHL